MLVIKTLYIHVEYAVILTGVKGNMDIYQYLFCWLISSDHRSPYFEGSRVTKDHLSRYDFLASWEESPDSLCQSVSVA